MALDFDGTGDYLTGTARFNSTQRLSIACWLRPDTLTAYDGLVLARPGSPGQGLLISGGAGSPLTYMWDETTDEYDAANGLIMTTGTWYLCGVAVGPTAATVYLAAYNATSLSSWTNTKTHAARSPSNWGIANDLDFGSTDHDGRFAEIAWWNETLPASDFQKLRSGWSPPMLRRRSLIQYIRCLRDSSALDGLPWTRNGTPTAVAHPPNILMNQQGKVFGRSPAAVDRFVPFRSSSRENIHYKVR